MDSFPSCHVCHEHFTLKGPVPYLLPCLHAVCETCVTTTAGGVISCSTCQREVSLTETHLQKDVVRQREIFHLTVQHRPSELLCTHEDDGNQAVCWCQECEEFLCEYCQNMHESFKATRKHVVQDIADIQPGNLDLEEYCQIHKMYPLDMWDRNCEMLICAKCRRMDHAEHDVEDIDVAVDSAKTEMAAQEREARQVSEGHGSVVNTTRLQDQSLDETSVTLRAKISHIFNSLKSLLDQREKELLVVLQQRTAQTKSQLNSKTSTAHSNQQRCQLTKEFIRKTLLYSSKYDILRLKKTISESSQICLACAEPEKQEDFPPLGFHTDGLDKINETLSSFGDIATWNDTVSQRNPIEDLQRQLQKLETEVSQLQMSVRKLTREKHDMEKHGMEMSSFLEMQLKQQGIHLLKPDSMDTSLLLKCLHLKYDTEKVNLKMTHINDAGELVNKPDTRAGGDTSGRFQNYCGTTSTVPLPLTDSPQYVEVLTKVGIDRLLEERDLVLDTGICRERDRDLEPCISARQYCYSLDVYQCPLHNSVCTRVWKDGNVVHHLPDTLPNTAGSHTTLHHGVVFDKARNRIVFLDVEEMKIIGALDNVDYTQPMWPMFGLYAQSKARISMKLVVGNDIDMAPEKKSMILKALQNKCITL